MAPVHRATGSAHRRATPTSSASRLIRIAILRSPGEPPRDGSGPSEARSRRPQVRSWHQSASRARTNRSRRPGSSIAGIVWTSSGLPSSAAAASDLEDAKGMVDLLHRGVGDGTAVMCGTTRARSVPDASPRSRGDRRAMRPTSIGEGVRPVPGGVQPMTALRRSRRSSSRAGPRGDPAPRRRRRRHRGRRARAERRG